ncbi:P-loop containing nucleoside triphosphate hydrolase protein [Immersiella caudata]|uniref:P-loop containing nucleoside triphosphate hydrolase protein n=1 Tax=Immersiella caudata TaxID=314043 RepID=A0AA39WYA9_9PEZI|nr:P-loop containing nucleoside triphosphate hydrolase protein [Immersiella caudata]
MSTPIISKLSSPTPTTMTQPAGPEQFTIVLLGVTGAGKSTFASIASGKKVIVGHGVDPCTQDPLAVEFPLGDRNVILIDTPGFDDDLRSDVEILRDIADWLGKEGYITKDRPLDGLILLHPATHTVISRNERKRSRLLEKILGENAYSRVVIATTMWENIGPDCFTRSHSRRVGATGPWTNFCKKGATIIKHDNSTTSAHDIIQLIISNASNQKPGSKTQTLLDAAFATPLSEEIRAQLEEEVDLAWKLLQDHRKHRPPKEWKKSKDLLERSRYQHWEREMRDDWRREKKELEKTLKGHQKKLMGMETTIVRAINAFAKLFR